MEHRFSTLWSSQQHRAEPVVTADAAIGVARAEQPSAGTIVRVTATQEPTKARVDKVGVIVAPGLAAARDRLVLLSFV